MNFFSSHDKGSGGRLQTGALSPPSPPQPPPPAPANPPELNVPELSNGAAVHRMPNEAANKEAELFVLTGEPLQCSTAAVH